MKIVPYPQRFKILRRPQTAIRMAGVKAAEAHSQSVQVNSDAQGQSIDYWSTFCLDTTYVVV